MTQEKMHQQNVDHEYWLKNIEETQEKGPKYVV